MGDPDKTASGGFKNPLNGYTKPALEWMARSLIALLCFLALRSLDDMKELQKAANESRNRITIQEVLRTEDRKVLEDVQKKVNEIAEDVSAMAGRMGVGSGR